MDDLCSILNPYVSPEVLLKVAKEIDVIVNELKADIEALHERVDELERKA